MPLPDDRGRQGDARPKVHRFRSYGVELGQRLRAFRDCHDLTQAEVAAAIGAGSKTTVAQWEIGARTPEGVLRERVEALVAGRLWPDVRESVTAQAAVGTGVGIYMPARWLEAVRWYRRASRERAVRAALGSAIAAGLAGLRGFRRPEELRARYLAASRTWGSSLPRDAVPESSTATDKRRAEDTAFGLRWLELAYGVKVDPTRSLVSQLPLPLARGPAVDRSAS